MRRLLALLFAACPASAQAVSRVSLQSAPAAVPLIAPTPPVPLLTALPLPDAPMAMMPTLPSIRPALIPPAEEAIVPAILAAPAELSVGERLLARSAAKAVAAFRKEASVMTESAAAPDLDAGRAANLRFFDDGNPYRSPEPVVMHAPDARKRRLRNAWLRRQENETSSGFVRFLAATVITTIPSAALAPVLESWRVAPPTAPLVWPAFLIFTGALVSVALASSLIMFVHLLTFSSLQALRSLRVARRRALTGKN